MIAFLILLFLSPSSSLAKKQRAGDQFLKKMESQFYFLPAEKLSELDPHVQIKYLTQIRSVVDQLPRKYQLKFGAYKSTKSKCSLKGALDCNVVFYGRGSCVDPGSVQTRLCSTAKPAIKAFKKKGLQEKGRLESWAQFRIIVTNECQKKKLPRGLRKACRVLKKLNSSS